MSGPLKLSSDSQFVSVTDAHRRAPRAFPKGYEVPLCHHPGRSTTRSLRNLESVRASLRRYHMVTLDSRDVGGIKRRRAME